MPQRKFWAEVHETDLTFRLQLDPNRPGQSRLTAQVFDQAGDITAAASLILPPTVAIDAGVEMMEEAWRCWEMADGEAAMKGFRRAHTQWVDIAEALAQTR